MARRQLGQAMFGRDDEAILARVSTTKPRPPPTVRTDRAQLSRVRFASAIAIDAFSLVASSHNVCGRSMTTKCRVIEAIIACTCQGAKGLTEWASVKDLAETQANSGLIHPNSIGARWSEASTRQGIRCVWASTARDDLSRLFATAAAIRRSDWSGNPQAPWHPRPRSLRDRSPSSARRPHQSSARVAASSDTGCHAGPPYRRHCRDTTQARVAIMVQSAWIDAAECRNPILLKF